MSLFSSITWIVIPSFRSLLVDEPFAVLILLGLFGCGAGGGFDASCGCTWEPPVVVPPPIGVGFIADATMDWPVL
jgi:hypothetical protein